LIIWLIVFLFLQTKPSFCRIAWSQAAIPAVSLTSRQTWQNVNSKRRLQKIPNVREGKRHQKKRHLASFVFVLSVVGEKFSTAEF
jgi:hypothetical protein